MSEIQSETRPNRPISHTLSASEMSECPLGHGHSDGHATSDTTSDLGALA